MKMGIEESVSYRVASAIRSFVLRRGAGERRITGTSIGGDFTFSLDSDAEEFLIEYLKREGLPFACYTEDKGLVTPEGADVEGILIVDPVDGSRPHLAGIPVACVSVAVARPSEAPVFADIVEGCVLKIAGDEVYWARRGEGALAMRGEEPLSLIPSEVDGIERMAWIFEIAGRPTSLVATALAPLLDASSLSGGSFSFAASAYSLCLLARGKVDAFVDPTPRLYDELGMFPDEPRMGLHPYDIAAAWLILSELGCPATDAWGNPLDSESVFTVPDHFVSLIAASNPVLHKRIMDVIDERIDAMRRGEVAICGRSTPPKKHYKNPTPTVDCIIELEGGIVLIERKNPPYGWAIPGGYVDYGETVEEAAVREAKEETGLDVELVRQFHVYSDPARDPRQHNLSGVFICRARGTPKAASDAKSIGIFTRDTLPEPICFDHRRILEDYFEGRY
ncbi:MAG TPA: NUDIX domain-containing protein [Proteobacteria bacterium]|nr:NUDIX domain-containing protein [Pseudomonadota bacterium]